MGRQTERDSDRDIQTFQSDGPIDRNRFRLIETITVVKKKKS